MEPPREEEEEEERSEEWLQTVVAEKWIYERRLWNCLGFTTYMVPKKNGFKKLREFTYRTHLPLRKGVIVAVTQGPLMRQKRFKVMALGQVVSGRYDTTTLRILHSFGEKEFVEEEITVVANTRVAIPYEWTFDRIAELAFTK